MFGETVHFKVATDKAIRNKAESDWQTGFFVGVNGGSTEFLIINENGLFKCRSMRRLEKEKACDEETLKKATKTIDEYIEKGASSTLPGVRGGNAEHVGVPADRDGYAPRRAKLKAEDFAKFGYTIGCKGCTWLQDGVGGRQGHTEECRKRAESEIEKTSDGKDRVRRATDRQDQWAAEEIAKADGDTDIVDLPDRVKDISTRGETDDQAHSTRDENGGVDGGDVIDGGDEDMMTDGNEDRTTDRNEDRTTDRNDDKRRDEAASASLRRQQSRPR
jgi:hypothetical protein